MKSFKDYLVESQDTGKGNYVSIGCEIPEIINDDLDFDTGKPNKEPHITLIYSKNSNVDPKKIQEYLENTYKKGSTACKVIEAAKFDSLPKDGERDENLACVVLKLKSTKLEQIHSDLKDFGLKHSYPDFSAHLTLYYNVDRAEASKWVDKINNEKILKDMLIPVSGFKSNTIIKDWSESVVMESTELDISFASLVKSNNGLFKSDAQAKFLLSKCDGKEYITGGSMYGNTFQLTYYCDNRGVTKVEKYTKAAGPKIQWTRKEAGTLSVQDEKELKRLNRLLKQTEKSIADREASMKAGTYHADKSLYDDSMKRDNDSLKQIKQMIEKLK